MTAVDQLARGAEQIVLGALMLDAAVVEKVAPRLDAVQFHHPRHGTIYQHVLAAHTAGEPTEPVALARRLDTAGDLARTGGAPYLHDLVAAVPLAVHVDHYVDIVLDAAERRAVGEQAARLGQAAEITDPDRRRLLVADVAERLTGQPATTERDSWQPVDLGPYLRGEVERPQPTIGVARRDGLQFIYPGKEHSVIGEMEAGKSWFSLACVAAELSASRTVVYVHFEEADPSDTVERLQALGVHDRDIQAGFRFVAPDRPISPQQVARLADPVPSLVVLDGVNEGMALHAAAIRDEDGVALFRRLLIKPFIHAGSAVLGCDHVVKDRENRGRYALGSIHKGNALSGALILLENADPFGRGARGRSHVYVTKDRPGHLRRYGRGTKTSGKTFMGEMVVDDTRKYVSYLDLAILPPPDEQDRPADADAAGGLADTVWQVVAGHEGGVVESDRALFALMRKAGAQARNTAILDAADDLTVAGRLLQTRGARGSKVYRAVTASQDQSGEPS